MLYMFARDVFMCDLNLNIVAKQPKPFSVDFIPVIGNQNS